MITQNPDLKISSLNTNSKSNIITNHKLVFEKQAQLHRNTKTLNTESEH